MESRNLFLAVFLSLAILLSYQYFFPAPPQVPVDQPQTTESTTSENTTQAPIPAERVSDPSSAPQQTLAMPAVPTVAPTRPAKDIMVDTSLFTAIFTEAGGALKSIQLKNYLTSLDKDSGPKELITTDALADFPLHFSWNTKAEMPIIPVLPADNEKLILGPGNEQGKLMMRGHLASGLELTRTMLFDDQDYRIELEVVLQNPTQTAIQGEPLLRLTHKPFPEDKDSRLLFAGAAAYADDILHEMKTDDLLEEPSTIQGKIDWVGYENTYFICAVMPEENASQTAHFSISGRDTANIILSGKEEIIPPGGAKVFNYTIFFGPKKLSLMEEIGSNLDKSVDFGWFTAIARPTLYLLNFFNKYINNYGIAIILVTILIKLIFWPIASKGMKSMKNMQKIQPKMAKIREKYKDDKERLNVEMMNLYRTYKVNPVGGCLPMLLQIPVFFALYKVLLQAIELRHAPFFLWINDLSAPDRLFIGIDIPFLGGLPVLTLLMGGSMFLQQKMTPTSADPTQARVMMFLPVVFTFMFLNFASGLVLYWFVNNLLAMAQQYMINKQADA